MHFGKQAILLRKQDKSINEIVKITGHGKSSVYPYIKDLPLSKERQEKVRKSHTERIIAYNKKRRGVSKRKFKTFVIWDKDTVFFTSHLLFDGEINHSSCIYNNRSHDLIESFVESMQKIYLHEPKFLINKETGVVRVSYYNVALAGYMKQKAKRLLDEIPNLPMELKRVFLQSFFDDEGCMDFRPKENRRRIRGYQRDDGVLKLTNKLLQDFGIESSFGKSYVNEVFITGKENLIKFRDEINFSPGVRINGKRKNSIWKKDLEKRKILDMAISSYQS